MFKFDHLPTPHLVTPLPGPVAAALLERDDKYVSPSYTRCYPLVVEEGSGAVVVDVDGNRFLDFTAGIAVTNTGHCHPHVVAAVRDQAGKLLHMSGTDFYYRPQIELAERLAKVAPGPSPKTVFFANSGAEAIEGALKLARWHTGRTRAVAFFGGFHGRTYGAMSLSGSKTIHRRGFGPLVPDIHHVAFPKACPGGGCAGGCSLVKEIEATIFKRVCPPDEVAAIFCEPVQGEGGYYPMPAGCLPALRRMCDDHGILLVCDEIQSGFGRTGKMFAVEHTGVEPDILCLAKGIASGLPLGAIVAKTSVMDWPSGSHASTFGGNPVACRAALATLDLLEGGYVQNAHDRGLQLRAGLDRLAVEHSCLLNVRGLGLMTAVDVVHPHDGHAAPGLKEQIIQAAFQRGLLLLGCGESALRFCPPLCLTAGQVETGLRILADALGEVRLPPPAAPRLSLDRVVTV